MPELIPCAITGQIVSRISPSAQFALAELAMISGTSDLAWPSLTMTAVCPRLPMPSVSYPPVFGSSTRIAACTPALAGPPGSRLAIPFLAAIAPAARVPCPRSWTYV